MEANQLKLYSLSEAAKAMCIGRDTLRDFMADLVRELVGHAHGNTADKYYNQVSIDSMKEELKKFIRPIVKKKQQK
jgi:integrase